jgi:GntR family transcriptional regulator
MEPDIKIEFTSGIPIYEQIAQRVLELIEQGDFKPGDQLPTIRQLAVQLGINFNTVARAYRILDQGSIISTQQGRGTYILKTDKHKTSSKIDKYTIEELTRYYLRKAAYLGFDREEIKESFERLTRELTEE